MPGKKIGTTPPALNPKQIRNRFTPSSMKAIPIIFLIRLSMKIAANSPIIINAPEANKEAN
jgi:hypothetical protein